MTATARTRWLAVLLALLLLSAPGASFAKQPPTSQVSTHEDSNAAATSLNRVLALVKDEFREDVPDSTLCIGAADGMKKYLTEKKLSASFLGDTHSIKDLKMLDQAYSRVVTRYPSLNSRGLTQAAIRGMLDSLKDPYTVFMDQREYASLMEQMQGGNFGGLGIYIELDEKHANQLTIVEPMEDTPADRAGLKAGDVIQAIDGHNTGGMNLEDATKLLRGPEGSPITLKIKRAELEAFDVTLSRAHIQTRTAIGKVIDNKIGYIKLRVFGENTGNEMDDIFRKFDKKNVQAYILDLRNNGGGYISTALDSEFLPTGSRVVSVVERSSPEAVYSSLPNVRNGKPLVVLVNHFSASASEITAGAIKDLKAGTLLGTKTYGKGSVQKIFPLPDGSALKITTAHYHTPTGKDIHKIGIDPDVNLEMDPHNIGSEQDEQMARAVQVLNENLARTKQPPPAAQVAMNGVLDKGTPVMVRDENEEYDYVSNLKCDKDGGTFTIVSQQLVQQNDHTYDQVVVRCSADGEERTILFDLSKILGR